MESSAALRPGSVLGSYPQREESRLGAVEKVTSRVLGAYRQLVNTPFTQFESIIPLVSKHAQAVRRLPDETITAHAGELRRRLNHEGLSDDLVGYTFALVRELACRHLGLRHHDVQLIGGWALLRGVVAEMQTGEGKTLTATLPACTAALSGIPVHIVTVNDYLVARDARWMRPIYEALGLRVGIITEGLDHATRRAAYACDITYCTNKQLVFDYLRDRLTLGRVSGRLRMDLERLQRDQPRSSRLLMRGLCYAIVDEADSVLIDEARTPLIISKTSNTEISERHYSDALKLARRLSASTDFDIRDRKVELTQRGKDRLNSLSSSLDSIGSGARRREELVRQALTAEHLFVRDKHYLVNNDKVQIIDEYTGRVMPDRSWEQGLHQMIEVKERCPITTRPETLARISYQRFFRRYLRLSGMTGTARHVAGELWSVYRLKVVAVPTVRPIKRTTLPGRVYRTADARWNAVVERIRALRDQGRPVLVGTRSVAASDELSARLSTAKVPHCVLNARQDEEEAIIVQRAGEQGQVTVATNMAGRGTDIQLQPGVAELGGLHVIATERHDASRIDDQLFGRCARQGDPGSVEFIVSAEDELVGNYYPASIIRALVAGGKSSKPLLRWYGKLIVSLPQFAAQRQHARARRDLLKMDEHLGNLLAFTGQQE